MAMTAEETSIFIDENYTRYETKTPCTFLCVKRGDYFFLVDTMLAHYSGALGGFFSLLVSVDSTEVYQDAEILKRSLLDDILSRLDPTSYKKYFSFFDALLGAGNRTVHYQGWLYVKDDV